MHKPHIVILGAGYGGIVTTLKLQKKLKTEQAEITLVNKEDYHFQAAWLHENAAGSLHHNQLRIPIRDLINEKKVNFILDKVLSIKPEEKKIKLENQSLSYDILIIALGSEAIKPLDFDMHEGVFSISDINSARLIREHVEYSFARYHHRKEKDNHKINIVICGGGATGVEFAGGLIDRIPAICNEYDVEKALVRVLLLESAPSILPHVDDQLRQYAETSLVSRGVEILTGASLKDCNPNHIVYEKNGKLEEIPSTTTILTAGVQANSLVEKSGLEMVNGKVKVTDQLHTTSHRDVFVVGDCANVNNPENGEAYPASAQIAVQEAATVASNVIATIKGKSLTSFEPNIRGMVVSLGHHDGIGVVFNNHKLFGWKAPLMKKLIDMRYLFSLGGPNLVLKKWKFNFLHD